MNENRISLTNEILVAFVDRELPADQMAAVEAALAHDAAARDIVYKLRVSAQIAKSVSLDALREPLPLHLVKAARGISRAKPAPAIDATARRSSSRWLLPLAASIAALAIGLAGGYLFRDFSGGYVRAEAPGADPLAANYEATLQGSLDSGAAAGQSFTYDGPGVGQGKITLGRSFTTSYNRACREFSREEVRGTSRSGGDGLACRGPGGGWSIMFFRAAS
jgi:anti-sigma factor RsiW